MNWLEKAPAIRAIILDIDGVLTDGRLYYTPEFTFKSFDCRDGHAIKMALQAGLLVGVISGREDAANRRRIDELGLSFAMCGQKDKGIAVEQLFLDAGLSPEECLFIGDDVIDIPAMRRVAVGVAVADAVEEVRAVADWVTEAPGGRGAVRETLVHVLRSQGKWDGLMARYLN